MIKELIQEAVRPLLKEVYEEGYRDGERRVLKAYEYGWHVGHADTMAALGEISIEEIQAEEHERSAR